MIAYRNHAAVRLKDVAEVEDSVEDLRNAGLANGKPAIGIVLSREPGANIIQAVDNVKAELPRLIAALPGDVDLKVVVDRSITIRGSLNDTIKTLITSVVLVILVVFVFLRDVRASAVPSVAVPVSIIGSFAAMYLLGFSLNNLSLDGADDLDRLRRRRRHRRAWRTSRGISRWASRGLQAAIAGRARGRLHGGLDQPVAGRGVSAAAADGRPGRPAVQRVHRHAVDGGADLDGRLADDDADDVRADPAADREDQHGRLYRFTEAGSTPCWRSTGRRSTSRLRHRWVTIARVFRDDRA